MKPLDEVNPSRQYRTLVFYFSLLILLIVVAAQLAVAEEAHDKHTHESHKHHAALIISNTQNDDNDNGLTVGIDYAYRIKSWLGLGGIVEWAGGDFEHLLLLAGASIHPYKNWVLLAAGGAEVQNDHEEDTPIREWVIRTGIAYQFPISDKWTIAPEFNIDFSEHETLFVYGIAIGFGF